MQFEKPGLSGRASLDECLRATRRIIVATHISSSRSWLYCKSFHAIMNMSPHPTKGLPMPSPAIPRRYLQVCLDRHCPILEYNPETYITPAKCRPHAMVQVHIAGVSYHMCYCFMSSLAMMTFMISLVPSSSLCTLRSRHTRSTLYSLRYPYPPNTCTMDTAIPSAHRDHSLPCSPVLASTHHAARRHPQVLEGSCTSIDDVKVWAGSLLSTAWLQLTMRETRAV